MTTYNTGNPLGSTAVKDLYDNAENVDFFANGPDLAYPDRFNQARKSWRGIEEDFQQFLLNSGYEFIGDYDADGPLDVTARNQIFTKDGEYWRAAASLTLPYTTVNNWVIDEPKFVSVGDAALRQDLSNTANPLLGAGIVGRGVQIVGSIAALRGLDKTATGKNAFVTGYYAPGDGGGGPYYLDLADITSTDNGGTVIVATDGGRWKLAHAGSVDVKQFGAKNDDAAGSGTDSFAAIQAALDWAVDAKVSEVTALGWFRIDDTLVMDTGVFTQSLRLRGDGDNSRIRQAGAGKDAIWFSTTQFLRNSGIKDLSIQCDAAAGHGVNIKFGCTLCVFENVSVVCLNPVKSLFYGVWSSVPVVDPQGVFDTEWRGGDYYMTTAHTVAGFTFVTNGTAFNENRFINMRVHQATLAKFFNIQNADLATWLVNNKFENINFENCKAGGLLATNARGWTLSNISFWDAGTYTDHLIHFATNGGLKALSNTLINVQRNGDALDPGVNDIWTQYADFTTLINCFNYAGLAPAFDWGNNAVTILGPRLTGESNAGLRIYFNQTDSVNEFAKFDGAGTPSRVNNCSVAKTGTGKYRVTFSLAKSGTTYGVTANVFGLAACVNLIQTASWVDIEVYALAGAVLTDPGGVYVEVSGI